MRVYPQQLTRRGAHRLPGRAAGAVVAYLFIILTGMLVASGVAIIVRSLA
jgi:hypothetical protein